MEHSIKSVMLVAIVVSALFACNSAAVKQQSGGIWTPIPANMNANINSITVTPPEDGYVMVTASGSIVYEFTSGGNDGYYCLALNDVTEDTGACVPNVSTGKGFRSYVHAAMPTTGKKAVGVPYSIVKVFPVSAGVSATYYLNGYARDLMDAYLFHPTLTALFVPDALP